MSVCFLDWLDNKKIEITSEYFLNAMKPENQNWRSEELTRSYATIEEFLNKVEANYWIYDAFNWARVSNMEINIFSRLSREWQEHIKNIPSELIIFESIKRQKLKITFEGD